MIRRRVLVSGRVQGVGFRASTFRMSRKLKSLRGFVRNLPDGRVEAIFQGDSNEVHQIVEWCRQGPPSAHVSSIEIIDEELSDSLPSFVVKD
ncbi:MAG: acylphosphatase [Bdellovibrionota bacterium]